MKRIICGALLFTALVGEINVGATNGLFTPAGLVVLATLYICYFMLLDSIVARYRLDTIGIVLVNFALYSVLITGLLHGEIADYVLKPENTLITTLIRVQCSLYPLFALYLLRRIAPARCSGVSVRKASIIFFAFLVVVSASQAFGFVKMIDTFRVAPFISVVFTSLAVAALFIGLKYRRTKDTYTNKRFELWAWILLVTSVIPGLTFFLILLSVMIVVGLIFTSQKRFRNSSVL